MATLKSKTKIAGFKDVKEYKHFKHLEYLYLSLCMGVIILGCLLIGFWQFTPDNVLTVTKEMTTTQMVYHPGDRITYSFSYCKTKAIPALVIRSLINGTKITFTPITSNLDIGCRTINISDLVIPDYVDPDTYHIEGTAQYQLNPIKTSTISWRSNDFRIEK